VASNPVSKKAPGAIRDILLMGNGAAFQKSPDFGPA